MPSFYFDPSRETIPNSLPDGEVFYCPTGYLGSIDPDDSSSPPSEAGWYYWACLPGCLPDGDPCGPFPTMADAVEAAQSE